MGIGNPVHLLFIGVIALIVLGPKRLPELARSLGDGMRHFRESLEQGHDADQHEVAASLSAAAPQSVDYMSEQGLSAPAAHPPAPYPTVAQFAVAHRPQASDPMAQPAAPAAQVGHGDGDGSVASGTAGPAGSPS